MADLVRTISRRAVQTGESDPHLNKEWLVTNGLGGYASGTIAGGSTRRYHGLLIAAQPAPLGRVMMLNDLSEHVRLPDRGIFALGGDEPAFNPPEPHEAARLLEFRLEAGLPVWIYEAREFTLEKRLFLPYGQNSVHVRYAVLSGEGVLRLQLRPSMHFRTHEGRISMAAEKPYTLRITGDCYEVTGEAGFPALRMAVAGCRPVFHVNAKAQRVVYRTEQHRGYEAEGERWSPGYFRVDLALGEGATLMASTESWETIRAFPPDEAYRAEQTRRQSLIARANTLAQRDIAAELVLAADQFIITPAGRVEDTARARASGDEVRSVIAGYHWFTDWGRDTMISLEGLTLVTGRQNEAGWILRAFAHYIRDGLIPNLFPEGEKEGLYHTADATLWFFHAIDRYLEATGDRITLRLLLPRLLDIVHRHLRGTRFGIGVDPRDALLRQGAEGYQLTWMDAKVGDWVVTPRRGKAVEINALWYNALRLLAEWVGQEQNGEAARPLAEHADRMRRSFNERFWYAAGGYLYDVVDGPQGDDAACRPNQVLAISLRHPVLEESRWQPVLEVVSKKLLTPFGLRTLAPGHPDYKPRYYGDLRSRDAAYHQGTVWPWLIGPFVDAWVKLHPEDRRGARRFLEGFHQQMEQGCIGSIGEIFDAEPPYTPRGCIAQAWSVAEVLRSWVKTAE